MLFITEKFRAAFEDACVRRETPILLSKTARPIAFTYELLAASLIKFALSDELKELDPNLSSYYRHKHKRIGISRSSLYRIMDESPNQDFMNLLSLYTFRKTLIDAEVSEHGLWKGGIDQFLRIPQKQHSSEEKAKIEQKILSNLNLPDDVDPFYEPLNEQDVVMLSKSPEILATFSDESIPWDLIKQRVSLKQGSMSGFKLISNKEYLLRGFLIMYPLTPSCVSQLVAKRIGSSSELESGDICSDYVQATGIYISYVYGINPDCKKFILLQMQESLRQLSHTYPGIKTVFARPTTRDGDRVVSRYAMELLNADTNLHYLPLDKFIENFSRRPKKDM